MEFTPGQPITAPFLSAPAIVKAFEPRSGYYRLEVVLKAVNETIVDRSDGSQGTYGIYGNPEAHYHGLLWFLDGAVDIFATGFIVHEETWRERTRND